MLREGMEKFWGLVILILGKRFVRIMLLSSNLFAIPISAILEEYVIWTDVKRFVLCSSLFDLLCLSYVALFFSSLVVN